VTSACFEWCTFIQSFPYLRFRTFCACRILYLKYIFMYLSFCVMGCVCARCWSFFLFCFCLTAVARHFPQKKSGAAVLFLCAVAFRESIAISNETDPAHALSKHCVHPTLDASTRCPPSLCLHFSLSRCSRFAAISWNVCAISMTIAEEQNGEPHSHAVSCLTNHGIY